MLQATFRGRSARAVMQGVLVVTLVRGVKLANKEVFGKQNPYVLLSLLAANGTTPPFHCRDRNALPPPALSKPVEIR